MAALVVFLLNLVASLFKPKSQLEAENAALRQQLIVLQRKVRGRVQFTSSDRLFFIQLYRWFQSVTCSTCWSWFGWPARACLDRCDRAPDGGMDRAANY